MAQFDTSEPFAWWSELNHGGLLIAPARLGAYFPATLPHLPFYLVEKLRAAVQKRQDEESATGPLLDTVLEQLLKLNGHHWLKGPAVSSKWSHRAATGETIKPRRIWQPPSGIPLPVFTTDSRRIGIHSGRRDVARVVEWLRRSSLKIGLLTNGQQWRLVYAGLDAEAWCEWDIDLWFEQGQPSQQVLALRCLLGLDALTPKEGQTTPPLIQAIDATRRGQAELTSILGERVRDAVESLIQASGEVAALLGKEAQKDFQPRDVYIAATRMVMRCVVVLFAEARSLLPRDNRIYFDSYSLQGLREQLDRLAGGRSRERLRHSSSAWPRLISLFRLVYWGSSHEALPITRYAGGLFEPGKAESEDPISRAVAAFESPRNAPSDYWIHRILELLTRSKVKVRQGIRAIEVETPIDFSDLSSEYIGILYESLLDYQLRQARSNEPIVFLNFGDQPALPLPRLQALSGDTLAKMFEKFKQKNQQALSEDEEDADGEGEGEAETGPENQEEPGPEEEPANDPPEGTEREILDPTLEDQVQAWAREAVVNASIVKKPRGKFDAKKQAEFATAVDIAAKQLYSRVIRAGDWYLVREGATRKGTGTFYTRPQLASPITRRALQPLLYDGAAPRTPEEILALRICDPAMGSGSFLISALRYVTAALVESLYHHGRLLERGDGTIARLADGLPVDDPSQETLPLPKDHPQFEIYLAARLKRHVVERCLYGVDNDALAVELGRLSLWVETMDPRLPFGFLDHKLKLGNALVGCWFDRFQDYPVMAWEREGGDKNHERFVHHCRLTAARGGKAGKPKGDKWTVAIKKKKDDVVLGDLKALIRRHEQPAFAFVEEQMSPAQVHDQELAVFKKLHALPVHEVEERKQLYQDEIEHDPAFCELKEAFDTWCAVWFWPAEQLDLAPYPTDLLKPKDQTREIVRQLARRHHFFHWELEFPDVFTGAESGFSAVIGNPPWEIQKPNSKEFFSNVDPMYRGYGKQEALDKQKEYFEADAGIEKSWIEYAARLKALSNWTKFAGHPFGDRITRDKDGNPEHDFPFDSDFEDSAEWHSDWAELRKGRTGYADPQHPFLFQGSADINTYKMFLEVAHHALRSNGRLGFLVPSGIYSDKGAASLRHLFLSDSRWSDLYAFQNERFVFESVHHSFKIAVIHVEKRGQSGPLMTRFRLGPGNSPEVTELEDDIFRSSQYLSVTREQIRRFSPSSGAVLEVEATADLETLEQLYANCDSLGGRAHSNWRVRVAREFDMTNDSRDFPRVQAWEDQGFRSDEYGYWLKGLWQAYSGPLDELHRGGSVILSADGNAAIRVEDIEEVALPLYQGGMVHQFDFSAAAYTQIAGKRGFKWLPVSWANKRIQPQYLMAARTFDHSDQACKGTKLVFRPIARTSDARTFICTGVSDVPCGHSLSVLVSPVEKSWRLAGVLNSFIFDWATRLRLAGTNLSEFVIRDLPVLSAESLSSMEVSTLSSAALLFPHIRFAREWLELPRLDTWRRMWAVTPHERLRRRVIVEALIAFLTGVPSDSYAYICRDCDHPRDQLRVNAFTRKLNPKGFWRVEKHADPEMRTAVLSQVALLDLERVGLAGFVAANEGGGWQIPDRLRLADYGLGHDDRAKDHQPVAARLGPRFYSWQLEQSVEESWEECERHAEILNQLLPPKRDESAETDEEEEGPKNLFGDPIPTNLFGEPVPSRPRKR